VLVDAPGIPAPIEEKRDHAGLVVVGGGEEGRGAVGMPGIDETWLGREHPTKSRLIAAIDGAEELLDQLGSRVGGRETGSCQRVQVRPELSPAREAVLPRHGELCVGQLGGGIRALQVVKPVLGELLQVLEVGTIRQRHGAPSFLVPGVRGVGRKVVMSTRSAGGFDPSRGPSAAWTAHRESTSARRQVKGRSFASDGSYNRGEGSGVASPIAHAAG